MTNLCKLARKYGTDKTHYTPFYSMLLEGHRSSVRKVLEIGIGTPEAMGHVPNYKPGASLRMWREYFPSAKIYGMDKDPIAVRETCDDGLYTIHADQRVDHSVLMTALGPFDLIVDDGSHNAQDQLTTLTWLLPHCRGLYIIEDVNVADGLLDRLPLPFSYVQVHGSLTGHCVVING